MPLQPIESEMAALGAAMLDAQALDVLLERLQPEFFSLPAHQAIFSAVSALCRNGIPVDLVAVSEELERKHKLDEVGGAVYLTKLAGSVPAVAHIQTYVESVLKGHIARQIRADSLRWAENIAKSQEVSDVLDEIHRTSCRWAELQCPAEVAKPADLLSPLMDELEERFRKAQRGSVVGISSGLTDIDAATGGWEPENYILVGGRPSMGKTAFLLMSCLHAAKEQGIPTLLFSLEMSAKQCTKRLLWYIAQVEGHRFQKGLVRPGDEDWKKVSVAANALAPVPLYIVDKPEIRILEVRALARQLKRRYGIGLVGLDYLQLIQTTRRETREREVADISRDLKSLARELHLPLIVASQLNREVEKRGGVPRASDLRESGALEQDADLILMLYRPEFDDPDIMQGICRFYIRKFREGPATGAEPIDVFFEKKYGGFQSLSFEREKSE